MIVLKFLSVVALLVVASKYVAGQKYVLCYYSSWAHYRPGQGQFRVGNINPQLCTHVAYAFAVLDDQGMIISHDPYLDLPSGLDNYRKFNALKQLNPELKTLLSVGGWTIGSAKFSVMAASPALRQNFIASAITTVQDFGFDGLDVDWEYPNQRDSVKGQADVNNFTELLKELREAFDQYGLLLSVAVAAVRNKASLSYDIPAISRSLDLINIMTYDMYGAWDPVTGHNAPLHKGEGDENKNREDLFTIDVAVEYWLEQGAPPEKLTVGVPFYGRTFILRDPSNAHVRAPSSGPGIKGPYTDQDGYIGYNEFCLKLQQEPWSQNFDDRAMVPYAVNGQNWVSYDNPDSVTQKVQYAMSLGLAGVFTWAIETDDFHGDCGGGDYPLLRAMNDAVGGTIMPNNTVQSTYLSQTVLKYDI